MGIVCWTQDTNPISELDAYKRAFEDDNGDRVFVFDRFDLTCSPSFHRWMMALPAMRRVVDSLTYRADWAARWPVRDGLHFIVRDDTHVLTHDQVEPGTARLVAILQGEPAVEIAKLVCIDPNHQEPDHG